MAKETYFKQNKGQLPSNPPEYLGKLAQQTWRKIVPYLDSTNRVQRIDASLVEQYCTEYELYRIAYQDIGKNGIQSKLFRSVQNSAGEIIGKDFVGLRKNPAVTTMNDALKQLKAIGLQLGLSPKARQDLMKIASSKKGKSTIDQLKEAGLV